MTTTLLPFRSEPDGETLPDLLPPLRRRDEAERDELAEEGREIAAGGARVALDAEGRGLFTDVLAEDGGSGDAMVWSDKWLYVQ